ncbi:MAG TPA: MBL fold metallo-hydrolase, partial [Marinobacter adhaerens]|nr:MBL fold metallo-hydrolase [Marinobacter adhaerens]
GDYNEILAWLEQGSLKPEKVYVTHGEMVASDVMRKRIRDKFGWDVEVPELFEEVEV